MTREESLKMAAVVSRARVVLSENGWCQGESTSSDGRHCLVGALSMATEWTARSLVAREWATDPTTDLMPATMYYLSDDTCSAIRDKLVEQEGDSYCRGAADISLQSWNDEPSTTHHQVDELLRQVYLGLQEELVDE